MPVQDNPARLSFPISEARVATINGTPVALVNGEPLYLAMYCVRSSRTWGEDLVASQEELAGLVREFAASLRYTRDNRGCCSPCCWSAPSPSSATRCSS
jgi:hypothetical protein